MGKRIINTVKNFEEQYKLFLKNLADNCEHINYLSDEIEIIEDDEFFEISGTNKK